MGKLLQFWKEIRNYVEYFLIYSFVVITLLFLADLISRIWLGSNFKG